MPKKMPDTIKRSVYLEVKRSSDNARNIIINILRNTERNIEHLTIESAKDLAQIVNALSSLNRADIEAERWEVEQTRRLEDAAGLLKAEIRMILGEDPDLARKICEVTDKAYQRAKISTRAIGLPRTDPDADVEP